ncbi:MAG TPA: M1 family metallopeptidase [Ignavibacteriaceae bacterium]|nr:M1 family metallopeptidase [Ignavibacteriaceae bacterium]
MKFYKSFLIIIIVSFTVLAQTPINDSGGPLIPEQAAYDIKFYDIGIKVNPSDSTISGNVSVYANATSPLEWFVLDLDTVYEISSIEEMNWAEKYHSAKFERMVGKIWIKLNEKKEPGDRIVVQIKYSGKPRISPRPPWDGGFTWSKTKDRTPWIATTCQLNGADLWWPCKDHPSDEADSVALHFTVPNPLVVASNGKLINVVVNKNNTSTYNWFVSTPINNYGISLNAGPFKTISQNYESTSGDIIPVTFWVLPEDYEKGVKIFPEFLEHLRFYEETLGPYPFRADKYGVVETPHLGMEHQTIIAYGNQFKEGPHGFDWLHHHELGHEWWGNLVTALDWNDFWLHEGLCAFMQPLYAAKLKGKNEYFKYLREIGKGIKNVHPVAPRESKTIQSMYTDGDIYAKGAWVLQTLRYLVGDDAFFTILRRFAYPDPEMEKVTDGSQCRFATTDDLLNIAEKYSGKKLGWFFEVYLRQPKLPKLISEFSHGKLTLKWETPDNLPFFLPVDVKIGDKTERVEMPNGKATIDISEGTQFQFDPDGLILKSE